MTLRDSDILNLPEAPDFISRPPSYPLPEFIELCAKQLPYWNQQRYAAPRQLPPTGQFRLKEEDLGRERRS
jgi:hypothetical protein